MIAHLAVVAVATALAALSSGRSTRASPGGEIPRHSRTIWNPYDYAIVAVLVAFSGLRLNVGTDYGMYLELYQAIDPSDLNATFLASPVEFGYTALSYVLRLVTDFPYAIFLVTAALTVVPMYMALKRGSLDLTFSVLIYLLLAFYANAFNGVRQGIAVSLTVLAYTYYDKRKAVYVILMLLAISFHYTALVAALAQWGLFKWRPTLRAAGTVIGLILLVGIVFGIVNAAWPEFLSSLLDVINPRYATHLELQSGIGTFLMVASRLGLLALALLLLVRHRSGYHDGWRNFGTLFVLVGLGACVLAISTQAVVVGRLDQYFSVFLVFLLPNLLAQADRRERGGSSAGKLVDKVLASTWAVQALFALVGVVYFAMFITQFSDLVPYSTFLE